MKEVKNEKNSLMYLTAFDLETVARFCSLFERSCPPVRLCVWMSKTARESDKEKSEGERERVRVPYFALQ